MKRYVKYKIISIVFVCIFSFAIISTLSKSGVLPINTTDSTIAKENKALAEDEAAFNDTISGDIVDCNGVIIQENIAPTELGYVPDEFAYIVGYRDHNYAYGLHDDYFNELYDTKEAKGRSIKLTIDSDLQAVCAEILKDTDGSVAIMKRHSGEIKALVSTDSKTTFSVNDLNSFDNSVENIWLPKYTLNEAPGSVSKLFSTACILQSDIPDFAYNDTTGFIEYDEGVICNNDSEKQGELDLEKAVVKSSNVYFAEAGKKVKRKHINELASKFLFNQEIECDFGTINTYYDLGTCSYDRASAFYGQGKTLFSTMSLLTLTQGVCDKNIYKPHIIDTIYRDTQSGSEIYMQTKEEVLSENVINSETANTMDKYLSMAAKSYGIPSELNIRAKTGTADLANGLNRANICSYNSEYIVILSETNTDKYGVALVDKLIKIYEYLV